MSIAPLPTPLHDLGGRRFSFYPPIRNVNHNEWLYRRANWSECVVVNARTGEELGIPRVFLGDVSGAGDTVIATLAFGAISVASAIFLILELSQPYSGLFRISPAGLIQTMQALGT